MLKRLSRSSLLSRLGIPLVLVLAVLGQIAAKEGSSLHRTSFLDVNIFLMFSYAAFLLRGASWAFVLRRNPLSRVYPFMALSYPLVLLVGRLFYAESLSLGKISGTILIVAGTMLLLPEQSLRDVQ